ncbi:MAG: DNA polymerase III subunit gamma/tau [Myxococcota bacterium]
MSYLAIARKWRPTTFDEIAGQGHVTQTLQNAIRLDRIHHAFLFAGPRGVGKTTAARALARAVNCDLGPTPTPCGVCGNCLAILSGRSPDVIEIDGASNNSVEDIRDLRDKVNYLPVQGRKKVYIIDEVHMLSKGAFNALLKTLEEPPAHVIFTFATTEPHKIPETILSRVQRFEFKRIPMPVVVRHLQKICAAENVDISVDGLRMIARAGEGSMRDSQSLLDQVISFSGDTISLQHVADALGLVDRRLLYSMLEGMVRGNADLCLEAIESVYNTGYDLSEFTSEMLELLRNATLVGLSPSSQRFLDVPEDERAQLVSLAETVSPDVFVRSFQVMLDVHDQVARAPRPRLVLEMAVARLVSIRPAQPIDKLIDRLVDVERRMRRGGVSTRRPRTRHGKSRHGNDDEGEPARPAPSTRRARPSRGASPPPNRPRFQVRSQQRGGGPAPHSPPAPRAPAAPPPRPEPPPQERPDPKAQRPPSGRPELAVVEEPPVAPGPYLHAPDEMDPDAAVWPDEAVADEMELSPPVPIGDEDDIPDAQAETPPPLISDAGLQDRFDAFRRWLKAGGVAWDVWADQSALLRVAPPVVRIAFPSTFTSSQAKQKVEHPRIRQGVAAYFPDCVRAEVNIRPQKSGFETWEERQAAAREERRQAVLTRLQTDPQIRQITEVLGGELRAVLLEDESEERNR